jgi:hypothetical protein
MKTIEESRESLLQRNKQLQSEMLTTSKKYNDQMIRLEDDINRLRDEKAELEA